MREFFHYLREAFWEMVHPRTHILSDEDQQSVDEQVRVRTEYIRGQRWPDRDQLAAAVHTFYCLTPHEPTHAPDEVDYDKADEIGEILNHLAGGVA